MLIHTRCPIDGTDDADVEVYRANFDMNQATPELFSARRMPDRIHYRMVRNTRTGCLRATPILDRETIHDFYRHSVIADESIAVYAARTYARYLEKALPVLPDRRGALEIGCGHGAFLKHLMTLGFDRVKGLELSGHARQKAEPAIRPNIIETALAHGLFEPESFSLICGYQVLDHLVDPNRCLGVCAGLLAPAGIMHWICHDIGSVFARLLGERCPMIDIEHVVLYDKTTLAGLFEKNGFEVIDVFSVSNSYPSRYWAHLAPVPKPLKNVVCRLLDITGLGRWQITARFGNMGITARKPEV